VTRAVVFDLWDTIVEWSREHSDAHRAELIRRLAVEPERFTEVYTRLGAGRETGPLAAFLGRVCAELGVDGGVVDDLLDLRRDYARRALVPRPGAVETIGELRRRGVRTGLISACTSDIPEAWPETELAPLFDATVFSCEVGFSKPDPRIYALACEQLGVEPARAVFVGDGANDELAGAERAGMRAVLILRPEQDEPYWEEARGWEPRIHALPELLGLV
jgi:putative hydrolase of the HAD superfamily